MSDLRPLACALLCGGALSCGSALACGGERPALDRASAALQRHRAPFLALDRWVRRAIRGADVLRDERALAETLFAKARGERTLIAAWVDQQGEPKLAVALPAGTPPPALATAIRLRDQELGELSVLLGAPCPARAGKAPRAAGPCVVLARSALGPRGALRVTATFDDGEVALGPDR